MYYHGLELPIWEPEIVLDDKDKFRIAAASGALSFVRTVQTSGPDETLKSRLERADKYFELLAELCNGGVV